MSNFSRQHKRQQSQTSAPTNKDKGNNHQPLMRSSMHFDRAITAQNSSQITTNGASLNAKPLISGASGGRMTSNSLKQQASKENMLFKSNHSRAVQNWQLNIDKQIERQRQHSTFSAVDMNGREFLHSMQDKSRQQPLALNRQFQNSTVVTQQNNYAAPFLQDAKSPLQQMLKQQLSEPFKHRNNKEARSSIWETMKLPGSSRVQQDVVQAKEIECPSDEIEAIKVNEIAFDENGDNDTVMKEKNAFLGRSKTFEERAGRKDSTLENSHAQAVQCLQMGHSVFADSTNSWVQDYNIYDRQTDADKTKAEVFPAENASILTKKRAKEIGEMETQSLTLHQACNDGIKQDLQTETTKVINQSTVDQNNCTAGASANCSMIDVNKPNSNKMQDLQGQLTQNQHWQKNNSLPYYSTPRASRSIGKLGSVVSTGEAKQGGHDVSGATNLTSLKIQKRMSQNQSNSQTQTARRTQQYKDAATASRTFMISSENRGAPPQQSAGVSEAMREAAALSKHNLLTDVVRQQVMWQMKSPSRPQISSNPAGNNAPEQPDHLVSSRSGYKEISSQDKSNQPSSALLSPISNNTNANQRGQNSKLTYLSAGKNVMTTRLLHKAQPKTNNMTQEEHLRAFQVKLVSGSPMTVLRNNAGQPSLPLVASTPQAMSNKHNKVSQAPRPSSEVSKYSHDVTTAMMGKEQRAASGNTQELMKNNLDARYANHKVTIQYQHSQMVPPHPSQNLTQPGSQQFDDKRSSKAMNTTINSDRFSSSQQNLPGHQFMVSQNLPQAPPVIVEKDYTQQMKVFSVTSNDKSQWSKASGLGQTNNDFEARSQSRADRGSCDRDSSQNSRVSSGPNQVSIKFSKKARESSQAHCQRSRSKGSSASSSNYNGFKSQPIPPQLKKLTTANQSLDKYMGKISTGHIASERTLTKYSDKANSNTMTADDMMENAKHSGGLGSRSTRAPRHFQSLDDVSIPEDERTMALKEAAYLQSLEVLEECSNEDNSPLIKQKKARGGLLRHMSSSPTNFINCTSKKGMESIRLSNQKQKEVECVPLSRFDDRSSIMIKDQGEQLRILRAHIIPASSEQASPRSHGQEELQPYKLMPHNPFIDLNGLAQLTDQVAILQQQMNSGLFIGGATSGAATQHNSSSTAQSVSRQRPKNTGQHASTSSSSHQQQQQPQLQQQATHQSQQHQQQQQQMHQQPTHYSQSGPWKNHQQLAQQHQHAASAEQQYHSAEQAAYGQSDHQHHVHAQQQHPGAANQGQVFRGVVLNGQGQPPHLSQQAQQMLHHKMQIQQNAAQAQVVSQSSGMHRAEGSQAPPHSKSQTQKLQQQQQQQQQVQYVQSNATMIKGGNNQRALASAKIQMNSRQNETYMKSPHHQKMLTTTLVSSQQQQHQQQTLHVQQTTSPNTAGRPGSNHRILVPIKQLPPQQQPHQQESISSAHSGPTTQQVVNRQPSATSSSATATRSSKENPSSRLQQIAAEEQAQQSEPNGGGVGNGDGGQTREPPQVTIKQPRTYKEIRQRLHQQQQMQYLRQQQQQWIQRQQQILLANNPGATLEQVNAIIQQSILNQQQQMAMQQQQQAQIQALQQMSQSLAEQTASSVAGDQQHIFPGGSQSAAASSQWQQSAQTQSQTTEEDDRTTQQSVKLQKKQTGNVNNMGINNTQQQVQIKQHVNGQVSIGLANAPSQQTSGQMGAGGGNGAGSVLTQSQNNARGVLGNSQQVLPKAHVSAKDDTAMSYAQLLKQECQYDGGPSSQILNYKPASNQQNQQQTNLPIENLKHSLQQLTSEILRKVLARSDSMNQLRQIIDLKAKKVKPKNYESAIFQQILDKEQQRVTQEAQSLSKNVLRIEDKSLIKYLRGQVKKMLKPFRGLQYDDYLNNEIHLNEIMATQDQQNDPIKESRKRHLRILDAALKEQVVDIQIVLGICVQISRQAFYNELSEYFAVAYEYIMANQSSFQPHDIQGVINLKKRLGNVRSHSKVQIQTTKKLDRMFWLLLEQNTEVRNNIRTYKERYNEKTENGGLGLFTGDIGTGNASGQGQQHLGGSANHLSRRQTHTLRSSSGVGTASPKVNAGGSSHNIFANKGATGVGGGETANSMRRMVVKGGRSSNLNQETYNGGTQGGGRQNPNPQAKASQSQSHDTNETSSVHGTSSKAQQLLSKSSAKNQQLAPLSNNPSIKKAQSLIQKKMKARDLDRQLNSQPPTSSASNVAEKTPDQSMVGKKRLSSTKGHQVTQLIQSAQQHTSSTPQTFHPRNRMKQIHGPIDLYSGKVNANGQQAQSDENSTENLFNLIHATKTKNTMILEPLAKRHNKADGSQGGLPHDLPLREEIGSGLAARTDLPADAGSNSQKSHRMRQTDYARGFTSNSDAGHATEEMDPSQVLLHKAGMAMQGHDEPSSPSKVFRSWSRPQIMSDLPDMGAAAGQEQTIMSKFMHGKVIKTMQVCTCAKFRKRIEPPGGINVAELGNTASKISNKSELMLANSIAGDSDQVLASPHQRSRLQTFGQSGDSVAQSYTDVKSHRQEVESDQATPHQHSKTRMSQDFKMRILTKKKVAVPPSAVSHASRQRHNHTNASSTSLEHQKALIPNRQSSGEESGSEMAFQLSQPNKHQSMLQRSKIVTYELCQDCGGQRPAGLPQVTSSLSEIKVNLAVGKVSGYHSSDEDGNFGTARLNGSNRSSTLSLGNRDPSKGSNRRSRERKSGQPQAYLGADVQLAQVKPQVTAERLNKRYLAALGANYIFGMQEFVIQSRARRIQYFFRQHLTERILAVRIIQKRWRLHRKNQDQTLLRKAKLQHLRKKVAINKIYQFNRLIKVRKVTCSAQLMQQQLWQSVAQSQETHGEAYLKQIVCIQRKWRGVLSHRYLVGKALVAKKGTRQKIWDNVMRHKYHKLQCVESSHLYSETMFTRENRNLEGYFWKQMVNYAKDLETRGAKIEQRLNSDFVLADWNFDQGSREWQNSSKSMTIKLEKNETSQVTVLRDKLVQFYISNQLPKEKAINQQLDELTDARNATQKALKKEQDYKKRHMLQRIKRQRLCNLFTEEDDIGVELV